jgi:hypothetical protein
MYLQQDQQDNRSREEYGRMTGIGATNLQQGHRVCRAMRLRSQRWHGDVEILVSAKLASQNTTRHDKTRGDQSQDHTRLGKFDRTGITCRMISIFNLYCPLARDHLPPTLPSSVWPMGATDSGRSKSGVPSSTAGYALCKMQLRQCFLCCHELLRRLFLFLSMKISGMF